MKKPYLLHETLKNDHVSGKIWIAYENLKTFGHI